MNVRSTLPRRTHVGMAILLVSNAFQSWSQDWSHRHAFAKSYWGLSLHGVPAMEDGLFEAEVESVQIFDRSAFVSPVANICATHFGVTTFTWPSPRCPSRSRKTMSSTASNGHVTACAYTPGRSDNKVVLTSAISSPTIPTGHTLNELNHLHGAISPRTTILHFDVSSCWPTSNLPLVYRRQSRSLAGMDAVCGPQSCSRNHFMANPVNKASTKNFL